MIAWPTDVADWVRWLTLSTDRPFLRPGPGAHAGQVAADAVGGAGGRFATRRVPVPGGEARRRQGPGARHRRRLLGRETGRRRAASASRKSGIVEGSDRAPGTAGGAGARVRAGVRWRSSPPSAHCSGYSGPWWGSSSSSESSPPRRGQRRRSSWRVESGPPLYTTVAGLIVGVLALLSHQADLGPGGSHRRRSGSDEPRARRAHLRARVMRFQSERRLEPTFNLTPLIDILFIVLNLPGADRDVPRRVDAPGHAP